MDNTEAINVRTYPHGNNFCFSVLSAQIFHAVCPIHFKGPLGNANSILIHIQQHIRVKNAAHSICSSYTAPLSNVKTARAEVSANQDTRYTK